MLENKVKTYRDINTNIKEKETNHLTTSYLSINETRLKFNKNKNQNQQYNCLKEKISRIQSEKSKEKLRDREDKSKEKFKDVSKDISKDNSNYNPTHNTIDVSSDNKDNKFSVTQKNINGIISNSIAEKLIRNQPSIKDRIKLQLQEHNTKKGNSYQLLHKIDKILKK